MKKNKYGTSVLEAMVAMLIITTGVVGMYNIYNSSTDLEIHISNKMVATTIARDGIEAITNIRDTNWIVLGSDISHCWNTLNYDPACIMAPDPATSTDIKNNLHYKIIKDTNNRWKLTELPSYASGYLDENYRTTYRVGVDINGFYTQTGTLDNLKPLFTREIIINYIEDTDGNGVNNSNDEKMEITSLVQWMDTSSKKPHKVELKSILSNWKK